MNNLNDIRDRIAINSLKDKELVADKIDIRYNGICDREIDATSFWYCRYNIYEIWKADVTEEIDK